MKDYHSHCVTSPLLIAGGIEFLKIHIRGRGLKDSLVNMGGVIHIWRLSIKWRRRD